MLAGLKPDPIDIQITSRYGINRGARPNEVLSGGGFNPSTSRRKFPVFSFQISAVVGVVTKKNYFFTPNSSQKLGYDFFTTEGLLMCISGNTYPNIANAMARR